MKGIVLCAGFGSRLAPLTDRVPKPLVPVANRPVLDLVLDRLVAVGVEEVGINLHHRADAIRAHLATRATPRFNTVFEPEILDTGGGIANFRAWVDEPAVLLHNSDIVTDADLAALVRDHEAHEPEVTMVLVDHGPTNVVTFADGAITDIHGRLGVGVGPALTYAGIAMLSRRFLRRLEPGRKASVVDAILTAIREAPGSVRAHVPAQMGRDVYWRDLGRVSHYLDMHREILIAGLLAGAGLAAAPDGILVHPTARIEPSAKLEGFVAVGEGCHIASGARLANCVVWPGTRLESSFAADGAVISQDLVVAA